MIPHPDVLTVALEGGGVLLHLQTAAYYHLNPTGLTAWRAIECIRAAATARPGTPLATFLADLERERLLIPSADPATEIALPANSHAPRLTRHAEPLHGAAAVLSDLDGRPRGAKLPDPPPFVTIIVPVRNGERTLRHCLESLIAMDYPAARREIVVVDNDSSDGTAAIIREFPVRSAWEGRPGASAARNRGIAVSDGEIVAFTDADCVVTRGWLRELVLGFESPEIGAVAGEIMAFPPSTGPERYMARRVPRWQRANLSAPRPGIVTASIAFRRTVFDEIGGFDPRLRRAQDTDFGWRFFGSSGLQLRYSPLAVVLHRHRTTTAEFLLHQASWGYGGALIGSKYGIPFRVREELRGYRALLGRLTDLAGAGLRYAWDRRDRDDLEYAYFDFLCQLGRRVGALAGRLAGRRSTPAPLAAQTPEQGVDVRSVAVGVPAQATLEARYAGRDRATQLRHR